MSQQPCLPVPRRRKRASSDGGDDAAEAFDNIGSMDAMEYLGAVVQQASAMPDVFVAEQQAQTHHYQQQQMSIDGSATSLAYLVSDRTAILPPPSLCHVPDKPRKWVDMTLANFSQLRLYLESCHRNGVGGKDTARQMVPPLRDRAGWHVFCVGPDEARGNVGSYYEQDQESTDEEETTPSWRRAVPSTGHEPSVRLVCQMDQVMARRVLSHLCYYVQEGWSPCTKQRSAWIYALLARLERPLHRDDAALLYGLLKELTRVRASIDLDSDKENLAQLNVLIVLLGLYFEQGGGYDGIMSVPQK